MERLQRKAQQINADLKAETARAPEPGHIYKLNGEHLIYVRTEGGEHHFVKARNRVVYHVRLPELPEEAELVIDTLGRQQAADARAELQAVEWNRDLAFELLAKACAWLPKARGDQLRQEFQDRRLHAETA